MTRPDDREAFEAWKRAGDTPSEAWFAALKWERARAALPATVALPPLPKPDLIVEISRGPNSPPGNASMFNAGTLGIYARAAIEAALRGTGDAWISVEDRLPEKRAVVLYFDTERGIWVGVYYGSETFASRVTRGTSSVTYWMPLPAPPRDAAQGADRG